MPNNRIWQVQALVTNGVSVGGTASVGYQANFQDQVVSRADGAVGEETVDLGGLQVRTAMECADVTKANAILDAAMGETVGFLRESGAATFRKVTLQNTLWNSMNLRVGRDSDAVLQLGGGMRFTDGTKKLADLVTHLAAQTAPTLTVPTRLYRAHTMSFDPEGAAPAITPVHINDLTMSLARPFVADYGDTDIGETALEVGEWGRLQFGFSHDDAKFVTPSDTMSALLDAGLGTLTVQLSGRGGADDLTLTIENFQFGGGDAEFAPGIARYPMRGVAGWRKIGSPDVVYTMNGTPKLFSIA